MNERLFNEIVERNEDSFAGDEMRFRRPKWDKKIVSLTQPRRAISGRLGWLRAPRGGIDYDGLVCLGESATANCELKIFAAQPRRNLVS